MHTNGGSMSHYNNTLKLTITGAAGQIAYALLPRLGELLINIESKIDLRLCDVGAFKHSFSPNIAITKSLSFYKMA